MKLINELWTCTFICCQIDSLFVRYYVHLLRLEFICAHFIFQFTVHIAYVLASSTAVPNPVISCLIKITNDYIFLVLAYPGCPGKEAIKCVFV